jgi:hypothetical protein
MSQPQRNRLSDPICVVREGNPAERQAQADQIISREIKQSGPRPDRRKAVAAKAFRRRHGDR